MAVHIVVSLMIDHMSQTTESNYGRAGCSRLYLRSGTYKIDSVTNIVHGDERSDGHTWDCDLIAHFARVN